MYAITYALSDTLKVFARCGCVCLCVALHAVCVCESACMREE